MENKNAIYFPAEHINPDRYVQRIQFTKNLPFENKNRLHKTAQISRLVSSYSICVSIFIGTRVSIYEFFFMSTENTDLFMCKICGLFYH